MAYEIGELDQRIALQRRTRTRDDAGGATTTWTTYATVWALVRPLSGRERERLMREEATANYLVVIRERDDVLPSDRIQWRSRELNIRFIKSRGARAMYLEIEAELGAAS